MSLITPERTAMAIVNKVFIIFSFVPSLILAASTNCVKDPEKFVVCYYSSWSVYRPKEGYFNTTYIDPTLCTHLVYTFAGLNLESKIFSLDTINDIDKGSYKAFTSLKEANPCLKTILAVGGWNEGSKKYSVMAYTKESREAFADSALRFLVAYDFDGLDIDWEYPTQRGGIDADKGNFVELLNVLHTKLKIWGLLLTVAVPISSSISQKAYDISGIAPYVDYVSLMAYDFTSASAEQTGLTSPFNSVIDAVEHWLNYLPSSKLVLGLATYARTFVLADAKSHGIGAKTAGPGVPGEYTKESGFLSFYELEALLASNIFKVVSSSGTYYAHYDVEWLSFDLMDSYQKKIQYALQKNLKGIMAWTIDTDDFRGIFSNSTFPILKLIKSEINKIN